MIGRPRTWQIAFLASVAVLALLFCLFQGPKVLGDTPSYVQAIDVMNGAPAAADFVPNRLLTTFGALEIIRVLSAVLPFLPNPPFGAWFLLNLALWCAGLIALNRLLARMFGSERVACLGALFLAGSYGYLLFGLNYLMDIGGWCFYLWSLFFLYRYVEGRRPQDLSWAAAMVGIGGLFKEYAFLGGVAVAAVLAAMIVSEAASHTAHTVRTPRTVRSVLIAIACMVVPVAIVYVYIYHRFGYTYLDWFGFNHAYYTYHSRIIEYIKSLGSLVNVLALVFITGVVVLVREWRAIRGHLKVFLGATLVSFLPIFAWPAITQRILTITVPFVIMIAAFALRRYARPWQTGLWTALLGLSVLMTFFMDSYILTAVNLPF